MQDSWWFVTAYPPIIDDCAYSEKRIVCVNGFDDLRQAQAAEERSKLGPRIFGTNYKWNSDRNLYVSKVLYSIQHSPWRRQPQKSMWVQTVLFIGWACMRSIRLYNI